MSIASLSLPSRRTALAVALAVVAACGQYSQQDFTPGDPFDPGPRKEGGGYGSGSGSGGMPVQPSCGETERRCGHEFVLRKLMDGSPVRGDEQLVELRGDYRTGAWTTGDALTFDGAVYRVTVPVPWASRMLYKFRVVDKAGKETWFADPDNPQNEDDGFGGKNSILSGVTCEKYTCAEPAMSCDMPVTGGYDWRDAVLYFVFVDRFFDGSTGNNAPSTAGGLDPSANWQGGDWKGVTQKIKDGYFTQLGVTALWITVPMDQTDNVGLGTGGDSHIYTGYHGYWPRDLSKTERRFGTGPEFKELVDEAHKAGLKVLIDYAMNHVHKDSPTYVAHTTDGWFNPLDVPGGKCLCGSSACPWEGDKATVCWFTDYLPDFNFGNKAARDFSVGNALTWMKDYGIDGFRLDAVKHIDQTWLTDLRSRLTAEIESVTKQHVYLVGETFTGDRGLIRSFVDPCTKLDGQFDFPLRIELNTKILMRLGKMQDLEGFMNSNTAFYGSGLMSTFIGNHDVPRSIHFAQNTPAWSDVWADGKDKNFVNRPGVVTETEAYERMATAMAILMTNRGVPLIYYGDEIGLPGAGDPDNRRFMDWNSAGYSAGQKLLLDRHKKLGKLRKDHAALRRGTRTTVSITDDTWAYKMVDGADTVYVVVNRSDAAKSVSGLPGGALKDELTGEMLTGPTISVPARSVRALVP